MINHIFPAIFGQAKPYASCLDPQPCVHQELPGVFGHPGGFILEPFGSFGCLSSLVAPKKLDKQMIIPTGISWKGRIESYQFSGLKICCSLRIEPAKWWTLSGIDERSLLQNMLEPCKRTTCKRMNIEQLSASSNQPSKLFADPGSKTSLTQHVVFFVISLVYPQC